MASKKDKKSTGKKAKKSPGTTAKKRVNPPAGSGSGKPKTTNQESRPSRTRAAARGGARAASTAKSAAPEAGVTASAATAAAAQSSAAAAATRASGAARGSSATAVQPTAAPAKITIAGGIAEVLLDFPPVNAFDSAGWARLAEDIEALGRNDEVNVILIAAAGRGFCAGVDIKELARDGRLITAVNKGCYDTFAAIHDCPVPVISAAHGFVLGGGIGIVGSSDIIVASEDATFGLPEIDRGALGAASHLLRMFPIQKVRKMLLTGEPISAAEAYRLGALESVVPRDELMPAARAIAASIASKSRKAVRLAKESLNGIELLDVKRSYRYEQGFTLELYTSPDSQEARNAFVEKREASFKKESKD